MIMGLGAAGCGYEFDNPDYRCKHLSGDLFGFKCLKYKAELKLHERLKEPIRLHECCEDASRYWESKRAAEKAAETIKVRQSLNAL